MKDFLNSTKSNRINILETDKDVTHIYELLSKHLHQSITDLRSKYRIQYHWVRRRLEFEGNTTDMFELFQYLSRWSVKFESINPVYLRIDVNEFLNKIL